MKYHHLLFVTSFILYLQCHDPSGQALYMDVKEDGVISHLMDSNSGMDWNPSSTSVFHLDTDADIRTSLTVEKKSGETYQLRLTLANDGNSEAWIEPHFPYIKQWEFNGVKPEDVSQLFPRQGEMANNANRVDYEEVYSGNFPFQFFDLSHKEEGGLMIQLLDETNYPKKFYFNRENNTFDFGIIHRSRLLKPGESWVLPPVEFTSHKGDWHAAFYKYRDWLKSVLRPVTERKDWFRDVYNFRQTFLYDNGGEIGAYNLKTKKIDLQAKVDESIEAFGGVDYLHLFDWGMSPEYGRCGDYNPWYYVDKAALQAEVAEVKARGIPVGLYHEGYLLSPNSRVCIEYGEDWQMITNKGQRYARFGAGYYYPCPSLNEWREYLSNTVKRSSEELDADGVYIDQFGFGWQYGCYNPEHNHDTHHSSIDSECQVPDEAGMMYAIKQKLPSTIVTYTEECPTDISTQFQDGSFTYAISAARDSSRYNPAVVNLARFAFPDYKLIEILHIDSPVGNDIDGIRHAFFNGEGLWLSGPLTNPAWFPETLREEIRKCYKILREHKDAFRSLEPEPLVATRDPRIKANYFPIEGKRLWTLYNISGQLVEGEVLEIEAQEGCYYFDAWNNQFVNPVIKDGKAIISLSMKPKDAGCLVEIMTH